MSADVPPTVAPGAPTGAYLAAGTAFLCSLVGGLALIRLLYEALFPAALWLGQPLPALLLALLLGAAGWRGWQWLARRRGAAGALAPLLPLLLNVPPLLDPAVAPVRSRLLFAGGLWLAAVLLLRVINNERRERRGWRAYALLLVAGAAPIYLLTMGRTVGRADTFEFQVVVPQLGIAHPTGYPLYLLLSKAFTFLPVGTMAWRVNLASAVYAVAALCLLFMVGQRLTRRHGPALLGAAALALLPTFWSQAIEAEVYTLHALVVAAALLLMAQMVEEGGGQRKTTPLFLALVLGLGLANHLTTFVLLPPALLALFFWQRGQPGRGRLANPRFLLKLALAFLAPLLLYAYLPLRWAAVNGEPMGTARFVEWVTGGRFQGALQLDAWLRDPTRYEVVGRLLASAWQPASLLLPALLGLGFLFYRRPRVALILSITWLGYVFYGLNYYVPDLSVFLLPLHLLMALCWGVGLAFVIRVLAPGKGWRPLLTAAVLALATFPLLWQGASAWPELDRSRPDGRTRWGRGVLGMELPEGAAILADSEKYPPLYYLQQAEGVRPDLEIIVLPDEAAYRAELTARLAAGQRVFLARLIPGLEGEYHLRSSGPLTEVSRRPLEHVPARAEAADVPFGPIRLLGYRLQEEAAVDPERAALTLYWQAREPVEEVLYVYVRWAGNGFTGEAIPSSGQHPANNTYPTVAWAPGEIVPDYHLLPRPALNEERRLQVQAALAPPFTRPEALSWQTVTTMTVDPQEALEAARPLRAQIGPVLLDGVQMPEQARPETVLSAAVSGCGGGAERLQFRLLPAGGVESEGGGSDDGFAQATCRAGGNGFVHTTVVTAGAESGRYALLASHPEGAARCGWLAPLSQGCVLGHVTVSGVPLPEGAVNFGDKIALLEADVPETTLRPGGRLRVNLRWQALGPIEADYTVFVQVVDAQDRIVGQVDSWPVQGTHPTSGWEPGEVVGDPYQVQLAEALPSGRYRLLIGLYRLDTLQRLPVLDESGAAADDKVTLPGLTVP